MLSGVLKLIWIILLLFECDEYRWIFIFVLVSIEFEIFVVLVLLNVCLILIKLIKFIFMNWYKLILGYIFSLVVVCMFEVLCW